MVFFIFSCHVPRLAWRHLRWNRRSPYHTCSLPGCCTCQSQTYWRWWWWNWQTCLTQTSEYSDRPKPSHVHSLAKWPLVQGHPRYCRSGSKPTREKWRDRWNDTENRMFCCCCCFIFCHFCGKIICGVAQICFFQTIRRTMYTTLPSWMVTTSGKPPATRARSEENTKITNFQYTHTTFQTIVKVMH